MSRTRTAALLLLCSAAPAAAQAPATAAWTLASGDYTVYGHTIYMTTQVLVPRIVYDTGRRLDSARMVDSVRAKNQHQGIAAGLSAWPPEKYCEGPLSGTIQPLGPGQVLERVQAASKCSFRLVIVTPRRFLTTNAKTTGRFSIDSAKALIDRYADVLPADTIAKYRSTILGLNLGDDYSCANCWGGEKITQAQVAEWARYARAKLPGLPLGVRVIPQWVARDPELVPLVDYAWAQYHTRKGEPKKYYDESAAVARRLGLKLVMGVNVEDCYGAKTNACSGADLVRYGRMAVSHPESCAFINWRYDELTWADPEVRQAWDELMTIARKREARECRRDDRT
jgi:hypothetical protein